MQVVQLADTGDDAFVVEACPQAMYVELAATKADALDSCIVNRAGHSRKIRKMMTFGAAADIHESVLHQSALVVEERNDAAGSLHRDIGDLQIQVPRMTDRVKF